MNKVLTYIAIFSVILIAVISFFDIDLAVKIGANAIIAALIIGILVRIGDIFGKKGG